MSQYPSPYSTPYPYAAGYSYDPTGQILAPARRAGILMLVFGGLGLVCGLCLGLVAAMVPMDELIAKSGLQLPSTAGLGMSAEQLLRGLYIVVAVLSVIASLMFLVLGVFVMRGSGGAIITSLVLCILVILALGLNLLGSGFQLMMSPGPAELLGAAFILIPMSLQVLLLVWLIQAMRAATQLKALQMQYQAQYWQYQQQQQMYGQQGGYAAPPPPAAAPPPDERPPQA